MFSVKCRYNQCSNVGKMMCLNGVLGSELEVGDRVKYEKVGPRSARNAKSGLASDFCNPGPPTRR